MKAKKFILLFTMLMLFGCSELVIEYCLGDSPSTTVRYKGDKNNPKEIKFLIFHTRAVAVIEAVNWDFGDENAQTSNGNKINHVYNTIRKY